MITKEKVKNFAFAILEIISALWAGVGMALNALGVIQNQNILFFSLVGFIVFVVIVIFHITSQNELINSITPNIFFKNLSFTKDIFPIMQEDSFLEDAFSTGSFGNIDVLRIDISNTPKNPTNNNFAKDVRAEITYYDSMGKQIGKIREGRWSSGKYPKSIRAISNVSSIDIKSNGEPQKLDLAVNLLSKRMDERIPCIFNNETLFLEPKLSEEKEKDFILDGKQTFAHIKLIGQRVNSEQWIEFCFNDKLCKVLDKKPKKILS